MPMKKSKDSKKDKAEIKYLLNFLKATKGGKYAKVDKASSKYSRSSQEAEVITCEERYFYGLS